MLKPNYYSYSFIERKESLANKNNINFNHSHWRKKITVLKNNVEEKTAYLILY